MSELEGRVVPFCHDLLSAALRQILLRIQKYALGGIFIFMGFAAGYITGYQADAGARLAYDALLGKQ